MTEDEAKEIIKNAKPIKPIRRSTVNLTDEEKNNTFKNIMKRWKKK